jgi:hypothetical protein
MATKLDGGKEVVRELAITVQDVGARELIVTCLLYTSDAADD